MGPSLVAGLRPRRRRGRPGRVLPRRRRAGDRGRLLGVQLRPARPGPRGAQARAQAGGRRTGVGGPARRDDASRKRGPRARRSPSSSLQAATGVGAFRARASSSPATRTGSSPARSASRARACRRSTACRAAPAKSLALRTGTSAGQKLFDIAAARRASPPGRADIAIKATDGLGGVSEHRSFLFVGAEQAGAGIILVDGRLSADGTIRLDERPLVGYVTGGDDPEGGPRPAH